METCRPCGCKGIRTCLLCEEEYNIKNCLPLNRQDTYVYCPYCKKCYTGWKTQDSICDSQHIGSTIDFPGIFVQLDFINEADELYLLDGIDKTPWELSQSGRRKQNFGPKCNFNKRKIQLGNFAGFPAFSKFVQDKFSTVDTLNNFQTIEQCTLEYDPKRGASIDPHIDDCWIWGERIVTVNLLSDSVLTMTYNSKPTKYNLNSVQEYPVILNNDGLICDNKKEYLIKYDAEKSGPVIRIPMPRRSLLVMYGAARYEWEHRILREDITEKRICFAYREFTPPFLENGCNYAQGKPILDKARIFFKN